MTLFVWLQMVEQYEIGVNHVDGCLDLASTRRGAYQGTACL